MLNKLPLEDRSQLPRLVLVTLPKLNTVPEPKVSTSKEQTFNEGNMLRILADLFLVMAYSASARIRTHFHARCGEKRRSKGPSKHQYSHMMRASLSSYGANRLLGKEESRAYKSEMLPSIEGIFLQSLLLRHRHVI